jgi:DNA mismatch repair protein MutL
VDWEGGGIHVQGYVSEPQRFSGRPGQQHFFVNRRNVFNPVLARALSQAYEVAPPGRHPVAALFLSISPAEIDVNVHPTKREIRFLNEARVFWALSQALRAALRGAIDAPSLELNPPNVFPYPGQEDEGKEVQGGLGGAQGVPLPSGDSADHRPDSASKSSSPAFAPAFSYTSDAPVGSVEPAERRAENVALFPEMPRPAFSSAVEFTGAPCLQIHGSFILVAVRGGFLLVNQRAAHERILYEKALEDLQRPGRFSAQQLLFPELVEFTAAEARVVERHLAELRGLGFDLEPFGATAFQLRGSPAEVPPDKARPILQELTGRLLDEPAPRGKDDPEEVLKRVARAYARAARSRRAAGPSTPAESPAPCRAEPRRASRAVEMPSSRTARDRSPVRAAPRCAAPPRAPRPRRTPPAPGTKAAAR